MLLEHDEIKDLIDFTDYNVSLDIFDRTDQMEVLLDCQVIIQNVELLTKSHVLPDLLCVVCNTLAIDFDISFACLQHTCNHVDGCRLSCSIVTENGEHLVLTDRKVNFVNCNVTTIELFCKGLQLDRIVI
jgi:hypothetical protein